MNVTTDGGDFLYSTTTDDLNDSTTVTMSERVNDHVHVRVPDCEHDRCRACFDHGTGIAESNCTTDLTTNMSCVVGTGDGPDLLRHRGL
jgi:hypothetical protein